MAKLVFLGACVGNDDDLRSVRRADHGAYSYIEAGSVFADHTAVPAAVTARAQKFYLGPPKMGGNSWDALSPFNPLCAMD